MDLGINWVRRLKDWANTAGYRAGPSGGNVGWNEPYDAAIDDAFFPPTSSVEYYEFPPSPLFANIEANVWFKCGGEFMLSSVFCYFSNNFVILHYYSFIFGFFVLGYNMLQVFQVCGVIVKLVMITSGSGWNDHSTYHCLLWRIFPGSRHCWRRKIGRNVYSLTNISVLCNPKQGRNRTILEVLWMLSSFT